MEAVHLSGGTQSSRAGRHRHQVDRDAAKMPKRAASRDERAGRGLGAARSTETNTERQFGSAPKKSGRTSRGKRVCAARPSTVQARAAGCGAAAAAGMRTRLRQARGAIADRPCSAPKRITPKLPPAPLRHTLSPRASPIESTQSQRPEFRSQEPESACSDLTLRSPAVLSGGGHSAARHERGGGCCKVVRRVRQLGARTAPGQRQDSARVAARQARGRVNGSDALHLRESETFGMHERFRLCLAATRRRLRCLATLTAATAKAKRGPPPPPPSGSVPATIGAACANIPPHPPLQQSASELVPQAHACSSDGRAASSRPRLAHWRATHRRQLPLAYTRDCLAPISAADAISAAVQHAILAS
ncbi:hypothetical protein L1887_57715 [Cichorium endivia]|nr:hypothetical protein L1887_57715 [Cichorium endivia]